MDALLVAAGHNMGLILNAMAFWLASVINAVIGTAKTAKPDTSPLFYRFETSMALALVRANQLLYHPLIKIIFVLKNQIILIQIY